MKQVNVDKLITQVIAVNRRKMDEALKKAKINVADNTSDAQLHTLVMDELKKGNPDVIFHVGDVLSETVDLSGLPQEAMSSSNGGFTISNPDQFNQMNTSTTPTSSASNQSGWWSQNKGSVFSSALSIGTSFLGGLFGKKDNPPSTVTPPASGGDNTAQMMMMMQQQQAAAQAAADRRRREDEDRRRSNMMIFGIVGGILLIGTIITVVALKGGKK
jgi:hypothetical protein